MDLITNLKWLLHVLWSIVTNDMHLLFNLYNLDLMLDTPGKRGLSFKDQIFTSTGTAFLSVNPSFHSSVFCFVRLRYCCELALCFDSRLRGSFLVLVGVLLIFFVCVGR